MNRALLALLLLGAAGCWMTGAGCRARGASGEPQVVSCEALCKRSFVTCPVEVIVAAGSTRPERVEALRATGAFEQIQEAGQRACLSDCNKKKGRGSDAGRINACLAKEGCEEFARCLGGVLR